RDNGLAYITDASVLLEQFKSRILQKSYNRMLPFNVPKAYALLRLMGVKFGKGTFIDTPFRCDYGKHITLGDHFYANSYCTILDVAPVTIGNHVQFGPNVQIITAGHPLHPDVRNTAYEYGAPVTIGDNVWIGAGAIVLPGVTIGQNAVIGAGAVVTKDVPESVLAAGNPCRVIRAITDEDKPFLYKDRRFDDEAWQEIEARQKNKFSKIGILGESDDKTGISEPN
ncbi:MAG: sugar O-acetyltransferase, partial [Clostridia bacterium]|nr:sugar O-acetyltransferase [Clostridia bacterium]